MAAVSGSTDTPDQSAPAVTGFGSLYEAIAGAELLRLCRGQRVLDLGHGAPGVTTWVASQSAASVAIVDRTRCDDETLDPEDLAPASAFDVAYALRTFAHLGRDDESSVEQATRLLHGLSASLAPGGLGVIEIANPTSLRGVLEGVRNPVTVVRQAPRRHFVFSDEFRLTRYDTLSRLFGMLPPDLRAVQVTGIGILSPSDRVHDIPVLRGMLSRVERRLSSADPLRRFGAFLLVTLRKVTG